jgi:hypothetical protein
MYSRLNVFTPEDVHRLEQAYRITYTMALGEAPTWPAQMVAGIPMTGTRETFWWPEPTIEIHEREASGKDLTFMAIKWNKRTISAVPYGVGLKIDRYQEHDLQANARIDVAAAFGDQTGRKSAMFPARGAKYLLQHGGDASKVDVWSGKALFATNHTISSASDYEFSNTFGGMPLTANNLAAGMAYLAQIEDGTGDYLGLERSVTLVTGTTKRARGEQLLNTEWYTDLFNAANAAAAQNVFYKGRWGFNAPITAPYFDFAPSKWWLLSTTWTTPEQAPLHMPELEPFSMTSFSGATQVELARQESLEYHYKGRVGFMGGRPERIMQFDAEGTQDDAKMAEIIAAL